MLDFLYIALFLLQVAGFVYAFRKKKGWLPLLALCALSMVGAFGCMGYFSSLESAGWAYFHEVFYSLGAGLVYAVTTLVSLLLCLFRKK